VEEEEVVPEEKATEVEEPVEPPQIDPPKDE
jgi:hypothetical protein